MKRVIIADDHPIYRSGIISVLEKLPDVQVVGEASNGIEAYHLILSQHPDIAVLDIEMPVLNGLDVCKKVMEEKTSPRFILLTMHTEKRYFNEAMKCGVDGYLLKDSAGQDLAKCIETVAVGNKYVSPNIEDFLTTHQAMQQSEEWQEISKQLTPTEKIVLRLVAEGKTSANIAMLLFVSVNTVENHRASIIKKLKLDGSKNALLKFALQFKHLF